MTADVDLETILRARRERLIGEAQAIFNKVDRRGRWRRWKRGTLTVRQERRLRAVLEEVRQVGEEHDRLYKSSPDRANTQLDRPGK